MAQPTPPAGPRPPLVQAAGIVLFVIGGLSVLGGILLFAAGSTVSGAALFGILNLAIGAAAIYAGMQVLALREQGRMIALVISGIALLFAILNLVQGLVFAILPLLLNGFVIYALINSQAAFRRA